MSRVHTAAELIRIDSNPVYGVQNHQQPEDDTCHVIGEDGLMGPVILHLYDYIPIQTQH